MRKKLKMRSGGKVAKYAEGGRVFDYEDMLAEAGVPGFERRATRAAPTPSSTRARPSLISNNPVGANRVAGRTPVGMPTPPRPRMSDAGDQPAMPPRRAEESLPTPPVPPRRRASTTVTRRRSREMSADELNDREMTRILNERSLEAARSGRNMYKKGGRVAAKKGK